MIFEIKHRSNYHNIKDVRDLWDNTDFDYLSSYIKSHQLNFQDPLDRRKIGDFTYWLHALVFNKKAVGVLKNVLERNGSLHPINCDGQRLFAFNVNSCLDILDREKSEITCFDTGEIFDIKKYAFIEERIPEDPVIFKIPGFDRCTYVNKAFADLVLGKNLTGFKFISLWPGSINEIYGQQNPVSISEIFERESTGTLEDDFDSEIWFNVCNKIGDGKNLASFPEPVVLYYASRYLEWEVANGGFAQAAMNIPELFDYAELGYEALNKPNSAQLIRKARKLMLTEKFKILKASKTLESAFQYFSESRFQKLDALVNDVGWWAEYDRVDYVRENRDAFISLDRT